MRKQPLRAKNVSDRDKNFEGKQQVEGDGKCWFSLAGKKKTK